ncbi:sensor domain-containing diguanylate cyclase [Leptolyngbya sp. FACHB-671]|uniref:GGDEF domain-containing protein n=1 Tax=Leptolyngbya sp. FACHB-671 TaxID=2692812 RepID=UPI001688BD2C|nr:sensor domain-containing diguanylate cyclase [Leptolyngbya sp. FACHB-671]MBD1868493.1 sensor domain-containing diguanylate cyclase [Cyanobacteria bacterium FACHB-471]MBD2072311.1 sensor domain-containing diguanylate cyclase [Leptolyngbya sp. FACHB-671]
MNLSIQTTKPTVAEPHSLSHLQSMRRLITVVQKPSLARSLETIMTIVQVAARELTHADGASFVLRDQDQCFYADEDAIAPLWKGQRFPLKICIGGWTMQNRQPVIIEDVYEDERIPFAAYQPTFVKSLAMVPIRALAPIGAIGVYWAQCHQPTASEVELLQALADTTSVALENVQIYAELEQRVKDRTLELEFANAQLREEVKERKKAEEAVQQLSITDELTKLNNRRGFLLLAEQQLKLAHRVNTSVCLLFIDLDGLKRVNDTLGHEMGDRLIIDAAKVLKQTFRESDVVARLGGDEFAVFVSSCGAKDGVVSRLQRNITLFNETRKNPYHLSMSIGLAICQVDVKTSLEQMMIQADQQMYANKRIKRT